MSAASTLLEPRYPPLQPDDALTESPLKLTPLVLGAGVYGFDYNTASTLLESDIPEQAIRLAFRYGIRTLDTSPYYTTSEQVLGRVFEKIKDEFPRESYQIITKAGRYGRTKEDGFDYSPARVRASVLRSMELMGTTYLDGVYMHDVEFVSEQVDNAGEEGVKVDPEEGIREEDLKRWGLGEGEEGTVRGSGDEKVLEAMRELFKLKEEGLVKAVGFSGFPLPTLLRLARLVHARLGTPLDILQSYSHHTLQNTSLSAFLPLFYAAGVKQLITASPLSMGLLRSQAAPAWHPASPALKAATQEAVEVCAKRGVALEDVALGFGFSSAKLAADEGRETPSVVGLSTPEEVHETMKVYHAVYGAGESRKGRAPGTGLSEKQQVQSDLEGEVVGIFKRTGTMNWTWAVGV
ncbi:hypothetical protein JCM6882_008228 [Rhodosporidiobolus microsporus]